MSICNVTLKRLGAKKVFETFKKIALISGNKTEVEKEGLLVKMLKDSIDTESQYLVRYVQGNLKIGAAEASMQ